MMPVVVQPALGIVALSMEVVAVDTTVGATPPTHRGRRTQYISIVTARIL